MQHHDPLARLSKLGLPRKKKVPRAAEQDRPDVPGSDGASSARSSRGSTHDGLVFVDECGANTAMTGLTAVPPWAARLPNTPERWSRSRDLPGWRPPG